MNPNQKEYDENVLRTGVAITRIPLACLVLSLVILLAACKEEETPQYEISGSLDNTTELPVAQALVSLNDATGQTIASTSTDEEGRYVLSGVAPGSYDLVISAAGYLESSYPMTVEGSNTFNATLLGGADLSGQILNSQTGGGLSGVKVLFMDPEEFATSSSRNGNARMSSTSLNIEDIDETMAVMVFVTDASGAYSGENLPTGTFTVVYILDGYDVRVVDMVVTFGDNMFNPITLVQLPQEGEIRIILNWGEMPYDLDAHLTGPTQNTNRFHIYFFRPQYASAAGDTVFLDVDDTYKYGPETVTIKTLFDGMYQYSVHNYSERGQPSASNGIFASPTTVEVYDGTGLIAEYAAPEPTPGDIWRVFRINVSNGTYSLEAVNQYYVASYGTGGTFRTSGKQAAEATSF